jgi:hypothetical protein
MANGVAALPLAFEPAPESKDAAVGSPGAAPAATAIQVGVAVANACEAVGIALAEGGAPMRAETRAMSGERLAVVVEHLLAHLGEIDGWRDLAQREGRRVLLERHAAGMRQQLGADTPAAAIARTFDELCGYIITAAIQVAAIELAYRSN